MSNPAKISEIFTDVIIAEADKPAEDKVQLQDVLAYLQERSFGVLVILLSLPSAIPGCPPPIPSIFAAPLAVLALQMVLGHQTPSLPDRLMRASFKRAKLNTTLSLARKYLQKIDHIIRPRLSALTSPRAERVLGGIILLFALMVMIPLPMTNTVPSIGIILIGIGIVSRDGLAMIAGIFVGCAWMVALALMADGVIGLLW